MIQLALILFLLTLACDKCAPEPATSNLLKDVWLEEMPEISQKEKEGLRDEAWEMFDFGWKNYISLAFPRDNLLPLSCKGQDWQGGMSITLLDALDTFLVMNRKEDMEDALRKIKQFVHFDMDTKVHVFEVVIRVLGGLLSGHLLLERSPEAFPAYDGILLDKAMDVAQRLRPAFGSRTGLPYLFVNLRKGKLATLDKNSNTTCTACAGTLLLEFGHLSALTGDPQWAELAEHAAEAMYDRRSSLGLVGGSINVDSSAWVSREATTGPGVDSYYEYLLKSYLTFGHLEHLQMFTELYGSVMQQLQPPPYLPGNAFLVSAHMDSGRLSHTFVSSLAAFWPAMQALVGLEKEAVHLHEGFLSAWREFGWLPELFGLELEQIDPHDPGYQLRPESIESNYILHALTQDPKYLDVARRIQRILNTHNRVQCGFASINNVTTGDHSDIQESYFLSETVKYLYLTFVEGSGALLDYFIFSTEGHLLPPQPPADQEAAAVEKRVYLEALAESRRQSKCARFCEPPDPVTQATALSKLQQEFPLLHFDTADAELIRRRRCVACTQVTKHMGSRPAADSSLKIEQLSSAVQTGLDKSQVLSQILCLVDELPSTQQLYCSGFRSITIYDIERGLPENAVILQLSWIAQPPPHAAVLFVANRGRPGGAAHLGSALVLPGAAAEFGPSLVDATPACTHHLMDAAAAWAAAATAPSVPTHGSSEATKDPSVTVPTEGCSEATKDPSITTPSEGCSEATKDPSVTAPSEGCPEATKDPSVTAPSEGHSEAAEDPPVVGGRSDAAEGSRDAAGGAHGVLQVDSDHASEVQSVAEVSNVAEVPGASERAALSDKSQPSGSECAGPQPPKGPVGKTGTGRIGQADSSNYQSQPGKPHLPGPVCAPLSPLLDGLLPQTAQQLVAAVQAAMLDGSCRATGTDADSATWAATDSATGAADNSAKGVDSSSGCSQEVGGARACVGSAQAVQAAVQGGSCSASGASADSATEAGAHSATGADASSATGADDNSAKGVGSSAESSQEVEGAGGCVGSAPAVQAAMEGGSCSASGASADSATEAGAHSATGAYANSATGADDDSKKGEDSAAESSQEVRVAGRSVGESAPAVQAAMQGESCSASGADSSADSLDVGFARGSLESAQAVLEEALGGGKNRGAESRKKTERGADGDQCLSEGVLEEDLCMDGPDLELQQLQQRQQQEQEQQQQQQQQHERQEGAEHLLSQAEAMDDDQECAAQLERNLNEEDHENMGDHEIEGDSRNKAGSAGERAQQPLQQQQQQTAGMQEEEASGDGSERNGPSSADNHEHCTDWAQKGECSANPGWMWEFCPAACQECTSLSQASSAAQTPTEAAVAGSSATGSTDSATHAGATHCGHGAQGPRCAEHEVQGAGREQHGTQCAGCASKEAQGARNEEQEVRGTQHVEQEAHGAQREGHEALSVWPEAHGAQGARREDQGVRGAQHVEQEARGAQSGEHEAHGAPHEEVQGGRAEEHERGPSDMGPHGADPHSWGPCECVPLPHGPAILASPPDACVPSLYNAHLLAGAVVVMVRGGCTFAAKAQAAQAAGAIAFVVLSPSEEEVVIMSGMADAQDGKSVFIPGMLLGRTSAILLLREMHTAAVRGVPWPEVTLALDSQTQDARERSFQEGQLADQRPGANGRVQSRPGSQQLGMLVPTSSIRYIQKLIMTRNQDIQSMLMDIVTDDEALLLLLQIARESGPNSPSRIQKRQTRMQNDRES